MTKYLISFPSGPMAALSPQELQRASDETHALVEEARAAGAWVFGGAIDEGVAPVLVDADGAATAGTYPETARLSGGFAVFELPSREAALQWAARLAAACRCAQEVRAFHDDAAS